MILIQLCLHVAFYMLQPLLIILQTKVPQISRVMCSPNGVNSTVRVHSVHLLPDLQNKEGDGKSCAGGYSSDKCYNNFLSKWLWVSAIRYRGVGRVCFLPPLFCPTKFVKPSDQYFQRKARRRRKNFEVTFFKKLTFLGKFYGF